MPELPEVETVRRDLAGALVGLTVRKVEVARPSFVKGPRDQDSLLRGLTIRAVLRHGKQLAIVAGPEKAELNACRAVCGHLGMTGQLLRIGEGGSPTDSSHIHLAWWLEQDGARASGRLVFRDPRRFGGVWTFESLAQLRRERWSTLGPDATDPALAGRLLEFKGSGRSVKAVLLDQAVVAGVGNIYADEALFSAGVRPTRRMTRITAVEVGRIAACVSETLSRAIAARGSTLRDYRGADGSAGVFQLEHAVYGRGSLPCVRCGRPLRSSVVAQRTTVWCPACQR